MSSKHRVATFSIIVGLLALVVTLATTIAVSQFQLRILRIRNKLLLLEIMVVAITVLVAITPPVQDPESKSQYKKKHLKWVIRPMIQIQLKSNQEIQ